MTHQDPNVKLNITSAKSAAKLMLTSWNRWKTAKNEEVKRKSLATYAAAATSCKVFVENYLKHLYPNEQLPSQVAKDIRHLTQDIETIDRVSESQLQKIFSDLDELARDAA